MNHYRPRAHAHILQGLILEAKVLDEMILDTTTTAVAEEILLLHVC